MLSIAFQSVAKTGLNVSSLETRTQSNQWVTTDFGPTHLKPVSYKGLWYHTCTTNKLQRTLVPHLYNNRLQRTLVSHLYNQWITKNFGLTHVQPVSSKGFGTTTVQPMRYKGFWYHTCTINELKRPCFHIHTIKELHRILLPPLCSQFVTQDLSTSPVQAVSSLGFWHYSQQQLLKQGLSLQVAKYTPSQRCVPSDSVSQSATVSICPLCCAWFGYYEQ